MVVVSSINLDTTLSVPAVPSNGETVRAKRAGPRLGGKGANVAVAVARSGLAPSRLCGAVGPDGQGMLATLADAGVDTALVTVLPDVDTGAAYILVDEQGKNRIIVDPGANEVFSPPDDLLNALRDAVVVLQLEIAGKVTREVARVAKDNGALVVFNPSPVPKTSGPFGQSDKAWRSVDIIVLNEIEIAQITGVEDGNVEEAIQHMRKRCGNTARVVVTLGAKGVIISECTEDDVKLIPAVFVEHVVDTTGAGDTFTGFLAASVAAGREFEMSVREAVVAAALCVGREGAADAIPNREEVLEWIARNQ